MNWIVENMKWILIVSGILTATMLYAAIAPKEALRNTFGETLEGPLAEIIVRNWGALIALSGLMLIYAAFRPIVRLPVLMFSALGKLFFILLVLSCGMSYLKYQAGIAVVCDSVMVLLFAAYLIASRKRVRM